MTAQESIKLSSLSDTMEKKIQSSPSDPMAKGTQEFECSVITHGSSQEEVLDKNTLHRGLDPRNLQMVAIGGSIGTNLFVTIATGLLYAGPLSLLMCFCFWCGIIYFVCIAMGEMVCYLPIDAPFIQMAGRCVDKSFEFAVGLNFFIMTSLFVPFELTAVNSMIHFWVSDYSPAITFAIMIIAYLLLNIFTVKYFGQAEFYLSLGKLILMVFLILFTFITMVGGNPLHDAYGFRYWKDPGPMAEYISKGDLGRMQGLLAGMNKACLTVAGPEYVCMLAGECGGDTRRVLVKTFRGTILRLILFYTFGALCVGIVIPYNDPTLVRLASSGSTSDSNYSPYVIAMKNMNISVLPHIVNVLCITSSFSAGNSYFFCSTRSLFGLAERGMVPKIFKECTKGGIPIYCVGVTLCFATLALLQLRRSSAVVLSWLVNLTANGQLVIYFTMCITYLKFRDAYIAQGIDQSSLALKVPFQPYATYIAMFFLLLMISLLGYVNFIPGHWDTESFFTNYLLLFTVTFFYCAHKLLFKTKHINPEEADLVTGLREVELHEMRFLEELEKSGFERKWYHKIYDFIFM